MSGYAEFNDADAVIRGHMQAGNGDFKGTFSASNVSAVNEINIRDNAVSSYYGFSVNGQTDITFTVPAQLTNYRQRIFVSCSLFNRPQFFSYGNPIPYDQIHIHIQVYKNGISVYNSQVYKIGGIIVDRGEGLRDMEKKLDNELFVYDDNPNTLVANTYRIRFHSPSGDGGVTGSGKFNNNVIVEFRKK